MRSLWKGAISFGLVNIPVKLYTATETRDVHFHQLHRPCHSPIKYRRFCPACGREVENEEIARGYEFTRGQYVIVEDEDLAELPLATGKSVEILDFVRLDEIDPIYFEKSYFLEPAEGGAKAYALLRRAMEDSGRVGLAKVALRQKESLAAVRVYRERTDPPAPDGDAGDGRPIGGDGLLVMETMFWPDEVRSYAQLQDAYRRVEVAERELGMAVHLVESLSVPFDPGKYRDEYREALLQMIEEKAQGERVVAPEAPEPTRVIDLVSALEESIRRAEARRRAAGPGVTPAAGQVTPPAAEAGAGAGTGPWAH